MQTKLFMGTRVTPDLKGCLGKMGSEGLQLIPFEGREYIGAYLTLSHPTLQELRAHCHRLIDILQKNLPDLRADTLPIVVFPQTFLG